MPGITQEKNDPEYAPSDLALRRCLVEGDHEAASRARRTRRKTFGVSLAIEILLLVLLVAAPLFTSIAQPHFSRSTLVPVVFGGRHLNHVVVHSSNADHQQSNYRDDRIAYFLDHPSRVPVQPPESAGEVAAPMVDDLQGGGGPIISPFVDLRPTGPVAPSEPNKRNVEKHPLKLSEPIIEAQLISRIEPRYPALPLQLKREGTIVLHAIIGRDGRINALEVVSGSPYFVQAALDAVRQWRYRPTMLNGEPVEVETTITVIFRLHE